MKRIINKYLVLLPSIAIFLFITLNIIAIILYPGSEKEMINFSSDRYSFTHNFLSELGSFNTNSDETNLDIEKKKNTISMILFNLSLIFIGFTLVMYYINFNKLFKILKDSKNSIKWSKRSLPIGVISGLMYAGVGLVPHDLNFFWHVFFANGAFISLLILSICHFISIYNSIIIHNHYSIGYLFFCLFLIIYIIIIIMGPQIGPGKIYTEKQLILQVLSQKIIVLLFMFSIGIQTIGIKNALNKIKYSDKQLNSI